MKILFIIFVGFILAGSIFTSCKKDPVSTGCDTCKKPCDTCNINQDSLTHIKDSLAHAFEWKEYLNEPSGDADNHLSGVWVFGPNDMIFVGASVWHFDGANFTLIDESYSRHPTISLNGALSGNNIFAFSATDFWLIDGIVFHSTDAHHLDDMRPPGNLHSCWGTKSSDMFFVGDSGIIYHYDGLNFTKMTSNTTKGLGSVWGTSSSDVWASGYNTSTGETILIHYNGQSWQEDPISTQKGIYATGGFSAVWAVDSEGHHFVATAGAILIHKMDDGMWQSDSGLIPNSLGGGSFIGIAPRGGTTTDYFVIGPWGFVAHWNGKTWKQYTTLFDYSNSNYYTSDFSMVGNTACIIGSKNGQKWIAIGTRKP